MKKAFIDSNIIIRLVVKDSQQQFLAAQKIIQNIEENKLQGLISILVINEIIWILENYYEVKREVFIPWLIKLLALRNLKIVEVKKDVIMNILVKMVKKKVDFTDVYLAQTASNMDIFSFDRDLEKLQESKAS